MRLGLILIGIFFSSYILIKIALHFSGIAALMVLLITAVAIIIVCKINSRKIDMLAPNNK